MRKDYILKIKGENHLGNSPNKNEFFTFYGAVIGIIMEKAMARQGGCAEQVHWEYIYTGSAPKGKHLIR